MKLFIFFKKESYLRNIILANMLFFIGAITLMLFIYSQLSPTEFLYPYDGPNSLSVNNIYQNSFVRNFDDGGLSTAYQLSINSFNLIVYYVFYSLGLSIQQTQFIFFSLLFYIISILSYVGFYKLIMHYYNLRHNLQDFFCVLIATLFYNYSLFGILNINSGYFFSLNYLSAAIFPLLVFYTVKIISSEIILFKNNIVYAIFLFVAALNVPYVIPIVISIIIYIFFQYPFKYLIIKFKKILLSLFLFVLFSINYLSMFIFESKFNTDNFIVENLKNSTAGAIKGGLLNQLLNYFSWGLYSAWEPKSIMTFADHYLSNFYVLTITSLYVVILFFCVKSKLIPKILAPCLGIFLISIFFAKGPQPPGGGVFNFLLNHISFFGMVRSPDNKFGIGAVFAISLIILVLLQHYSNSRLFKYLSVYFVIILCFISWPLLNGEAIIGKENFPITGKLVTSIPPEYLEVLNVINNDKTISNILIYPQFSGVINHDRKLFIGRDILKTQSDKPFLYNSYIRSESNQLSKKISNITTLRNLSDISILNIGYILIRKDDYENSGKLDLKFLQKIDKYQIATKVLSNNYLELLKINSSYYSPRMKLSNNQASAFFTNLSPVKYKIWINNLRTKEDLLLLESFNKNFKLYLQPTSGIAEPPCRVVNTTNNINECSSRSEFSPLQDIKYLFKRDIFSDSHKLVYSYANSWTLDKDYIKNNYPANYYSINPDGSINFELILFHRTQSLFFLMEIISYSALVVCLVYLIINKIIHK